VVQNRQLLGFGGMTGESVLSALSCVSLPAQASQSVSALFFVEHHTLANLRHGVVCSSVDI
jgi:hypothetical protein